ncbi:MAG: tRNA (adenosine(37)-N6)-dimethylallyltransferase MiaA [Candidatus Nomurabacteria bacterium]|jgi:tRNA dimethylallyltransferase|nr:tRNA (adenosine(37)-N6)-dimethylallyltransferase MiaA [Candidatus Nomurabacteria bacterium]
MPAVKPTNWQKVLVIVGPTASGKTGVAIGLAQKLGGEIISADSRAIYKSMDIGTAKPIPEEQAGVPHWGIDLVNPDERFTAADFKAYAEQKIAEILARGHLPIIVGGTGLYVDALIYNYTFSEQAKTTQSDRQSLEHKFYTVGIKTDKAELRERIALRAEQMFDNKIVQETERLAKQYSFDLQSMRSNIYPIVWRMINGELTREQAIAAAVLDDWHLAKRQLTWFKRNPSIIWLSRTEIVNFICASKNKLR